MEVAEISMLEKMAILIRIYSQLVVSHSTFRDCLRCSVLNQSVIVSSPARSFTVLCLKAWHPRHAIQEMCSSSHILKTIQMREDATS